MLSSYLSELYGVEPRALIQSVKRNIIRFPGDFMFQLKKEEFDILKSQNVISSWGGIRRATPYAFTEQGITMLSSVLNSQKAIQVNIQIMRTFVKIREYLSTHKVLAQKLKELESKYEGHDEQIKDIINAINQLLLPPEKPKRQIGFSVKEPRQKYSIK
jgi:phage regulator Rha-like protein